MRGFYLLGSYPLVGCQRWLKFGVKDFRRSKKLKLRKKNVRVVDDPVSLAPCCEPWLRLKDKMKIAVGNRKRMIACGGEKKNDEKKKNQSIFRVGGLCLTHVGGPCCETWLKEKSKI